MTRLNDISNADLLIVIPAFNEARRIADTISSLLAVQSGLRILVVDDGSSDDTAKIAASTGAEVMRLKNNLGKGGALNQAIAKYSSTFWLFLDADLGKTAGAGLGLMRPIMENSADIVVGDLPAATRKGGFGLVKGLARWGIKYCARIIVMEPLSGQRAMRDEVLRAIGSFENGYGIEVGLTIDAVRAGFRFKEIPVNMSHAETGRRATDWWHRGRQFIDVARVIIKRMMNHGSRPIKKERGD